MRKAKGEPKWKRIAGGLFYVAFLGVVLTVGTAAGWMGQNQMGKAIMHQMIQPKTPDEIFERDSITVLVLGCDEDRFYRGTLLHGSNIRKKQARADMLLVAKLDFKHNRVTGLSIPRDTLVTLPGYGTKKINGFHNVPGQSLKQSDDLTRQAVETLLPGVVIDRVLTLDYDAFQEMVNMVGGVQVNVDRKMDYDDDAGNVHIHLRPGAQLLDGYNSMMYVRFRHSDSDFKRQERQKQFLGSFKEAVLRDKLRLPQVLGKATALFSNAMTEDELASIAFFARNVPAQSIKLGQVPVREGRGTALRIDDRKLPSALREYSLVTSGDGAGESR